MVAVALLTRFIPYSEFFRNVNTLVHELAHAFMTLLLSGDVMFIHLYADQSGVTYSSYSYTWAAVPISLAGYMGAALFALLLFRLHAARKERAGLIAVAALALAGMAMFVRNDYGVAWCAGFTLVTALICWLAPNWLRIGYYLLIAFICLVESVVSSLYLLALSLADPGAAGDAANLAQATPLPAFVWALGFAAVSLLCAKRSTAWLFKRGLLAGRPSRSDWSSGSGRSY